MQSYTKEDQQFIASFDPYTRYLFTLDGNPRRKLAGEYIQDMRRGKRPVVTIPRAVLIGDHTPSSFVREVLTAGYTWYANATQDMRQYCDGAPRTMDPTNPGYRVYDPLHPPAGAWAFGRAEGYQSPLVYEAVALDWWDLPARGGSLGYSGGPYSPVPGRPGVYYGNAATDTYPEGWLLGLAMNELPHLPNGGMFVKYSDQWGAPWWYEVSPEAWSW